MATKDPSFALEQIFPGTFALQGILGGIVGGFVYVLSTTFWSIKPEFRDTIEITPLVMFVGAIIGAIAATIIRTVRDVLDLRLNAGMRVAVLINTIGVIAILLNGFLELRTSRQLPGWVMLSLLSALPTALLVGSRVKPWQLFTSRSSVPATLGILPLRFLSITIVALWILKIFCERKLGADVISVASMFAIPAIYPMLSAYLTFRSPQKWPLLLMGIGLNLPDGLISTAAFANSANSVGVAFTLAWALFLVARLDTKKHKRHTISS